MCCRQLAGTVGSSCHQSKNKQRRIHLQMEQQREACQRLTTSRPKQSNPGLGRQQQAADSWLVASCNQNQQGQPLERPGRETHHAIICVVAECEEDNQKIPEELACKAGCRCWEQPSAVSAHADAGRLSAAQPQWHQETKHGHWQAGGKAQGGKRAAGHSSAKGAWHGKCPKAGLELGLSSRVGVPRQLEACLVREVRVAGAVEPLQNAEAVGGRGSRSRRVLAAPCMAPYACMLPPAD